MKNERTPTQSPEVTDSGATPLRPNTPLPFGLYLPPAGDSDARLRQLVDGIPQIIWTNNSVGVADYFNRRWHEYTGLTYEQSVGLGWQYIVHPDDAKASAERWFRAQEA